jgi:hypothetical protein
LESISLRIMGTSRVRAGLIVYAIANYTIAAAAAGHDGRWTAGTQGLGKVIGWCRSRQRLLALRASGNG